ncbi:hypothetical protein [Roseibium litorale]|uniref:DeoR C-terminal sensor domain-containing protein n=1 Tax=Roseibium litorale TaxID=2803841 RepID=A0ABR9CNN3_9HYPH|nr:hypothetical protein [Roseibium litorale]MBD8892489.1 hypothetical protein [Roseibium litorale]
MAFPPPISARGHTVMLDNGSTACFLARELARREPMTILTVSLEIAGIFASEGSRHRVILLLDSSEYDRSGLIHVCDWRQIGVLATGREPASIDLKAEQRGLFLEE